MSMQAVFVQLDPHELAKLQVDPALAESLFDDGAAALPNVVAVAKAMQDRVRSLTPEQLQAALSQLDPAIRNRIEENLRRINAAPDAGWGGDHIMKLMEERQKRSPLPAPSQTKERQKLSLGKIWHGVHFALCGQPEPGRELLSQAVMGGIALGDDEEGFSGYGPARYFPVKEVAELSRALDRPELEAEAAARFDPARMSALGIYPGWRPSDREEVMEGLRRLRAFFAEAAANGRAIVTCLV
jgi:hypothetical protein